MVNSWNNNEWERTDNLLVLAYFVYKNVTLPVVLHGRETCL
jgi:hypothetical protein